MGLSNDLISQFVKATKDTQKKSKETTAYGTMVIASDGKEYVRLDGSEVLTPASSTTTVKNGDRVIVMIKNHTATVTGNLDDNSARISLVTNENGDPIKLDVERLVADHATINGYLFANNAEADLFVARKASIYGLLTATEADIDTLNANVLDVTIADIKYANISEALSATHATVIDLQSTYGNFEKLTTDKFTAYDATIGSLSNTYANIDFANIGDAAIQNLYSKSGFIKDITVEDGVFTGELTGVTISGDLIKANTLVADALIIQGKDGLYYRLNAGVDGVTETQLATEEYQTKLHGSNIIAKTIVAEDIEVSDLKAFGATIGGFTITDSSIYSGVKESVDNTTRGIYMDNDGQVAFGDNTQFIKYYKKSDDDYGFIIDTDAISFGDDYLSLAKNSRDATIDLCNGLAKLYHTIDDAGYSVFNIDTTYALSYIKMSAPMHDLLVLENTATTNGVIIKGVIHGTTVGGFGLVRDGYMVRYGSDADEDNPVEYAILDTGNFTTEMDTGWKYGGVLGDNFTIYDNSEGSQCRYRKMGNLVEIRGTVRPTQAITGSADNHTIFTLPAGYRPDTTVNVRCQGSGSYSWLLSITSGGLVRFARYNDGAQYVDTSTTSWLPFHATFLVD